VSIFIAPISRREEAATHRDRGGLGRATSQPTTSQSHTIDNFHISSHRHFGASYIPSIPILFCPSLVEHAQKTVGSVLLLNIHKHHHPQHNIASALLQREALCLNPRRPSLICPPLFSILFWASLLQGIILPPALIRPSLAPTLVGLVYFWMVRLAGRCTALPWP
jgi:hypothetical protein